MQAQWTKNISITPQVTFGKIINHSPKILYPIPSQSIGLTTNFVYKTYGKQYWNSWQKYPELGVQFGYLNLGNREILGNAYSVLPNISLKLGGKEHTQFRFVVGTGVAWLTKKFDYNTNPLQTAIGSHLNNITVLQFNWHTRLSERIKATAGFGLTHFSNGSSSLPNLGINVVTGQVGIQWTPNPVPQNEYIESIVDPKPKHKFGFTTHLGLAFVEQALPGGPKFPIYIASLGGIYKISKAQQLIIGAELEYNLSDYYFLLRSTEAPTEKVARDAATRHLVFIGDEFFFWPFSVLLQAGTYLDSDFEFNFGRIYTKLSSRYYLPAIHGIDTRFFVGVQLKAHKLAAEYISLGIGMML